MGALLPAVLTSSLPVTKEKQRREREREMAPPLLPGGGGGGGNVAHVEESVSLRLLWRGGDCVLRFSTSNLCPSARSAAHRQLSGSLYLHVDRFFRDVRPRSRRSFSLPLPLSEAGRLSTLRGAAEVVLPAVMEHCRGRLPGEALGYLADTLPLFVRNIAAARVRAEAAPLLTEVRGDVLVRVIVEEDEEAEEDEDEEGNEEAGEEEEDDMELLLDDCGEVAGAAAMDGREEEITGSCTEDGEEEEEKEEEGVQTCAICLRKVAAAGREVCLMPCLHRFHWTCARRWLQRKPRCPLCRLPVMKPDP